MPDSACITGEGFCPACRCWTTCVVNGAPFRGRATHSVSPWFGCVTRRRPSSSPTRWSTWRQGSDAGIAATLSFETSSYSTSTATVATVTSSAPCVGTPKRLPLPWSGTGYSNRYVFSTTPRRIGFWGLREERRTSSSFVTMRVSGRAKIGSTRPSRIVLRPAEPRAVQRAALSWSRCPLQKWAIAIQQRTSHGMEFPSLDAEG